MTSLIEEDDPQTSLFKDFQAVGTGIFSYNPPSSILQETRDTDDKTPSLVILCTWLGGATERRIQRYLNRYREVFPTSSILLIRTKMLDLSLKSPQTIRARLAPAREVIRQATEDHERPSDSESKPNVLLHIFSVGGLNIAIQLANMMRDANSPFPLGGIILDSCPGDAAWARSYNAAAVSLPSHPVVNFIGRVALYPALGIVLSLQNMGFVRSVAQMRDDLNDPAIFSPDVKRMYLYSKEDVAITPELIESHVVEARGRGIPVRSVNFERGAHCGLIVEHDTLYYRLIKSFWQNNLAAVACVDTPSALASDEDLATSCLSPPPILRSKL